MYNSRAIFRGLRIQTQGHKPPGCTAQLLLIASLVCGILIQAFLGGSRERRTLLAPLESGSQRERGRERERSPWPVEEEDHHLGVHKLHKFSTAFVAFLTQQPVLVICLMTFCAVGQALHCSRVTKIKIKGD